MDSRDCKHEAENLVREFIGMEVTINTRFDSVSTRVTDKLALTSAKDLAAKQIEARIAYIKTLPTKNIARTITAELADCKRILFHIKNIKSL